MKLESVEAIAVDIPLTKNFGGSTYSVLKRCTVVTRLKTSDGLVSEVYNGDNRDHGAEIRDLAWSGDGSVLASAGRDLVIRLWAGDDQLAALSPHASDVRAVAFVPDDRVVVSASNDGRVRMWPAPAAWAEVACALAGRDLTPEEWDRFAAGVGGPRPALC